TTLNDALTVVPSRHARHTKPVTSFTRSMDGRNFTKRSRRNPQVIAPIEFPMAVPSVKKPKGLPSITENKLAPSATHGQKRYPNRMIAANAMPDGGHTRATLPDMNDPSLPSIPPKK